MLIAKTVAPHDPQDYREAFPNTSFPASGPDEDFLTQNGYAKVSVFREHDRATHKLVPSEPVYEAPFVYTVSVVAKTAEDLEAERRAGIPQSITPRQARLALLAEDLLDAVESAFAKLPEQQRKAAQIEWQHASAIERNSPLVSQFGPLLGLTEAQIDELFVSGAQL